MLGLLLRPRLTLVDLEEVYSPVTSQKAVVEM